MSKRWSPKLGDGDDNDDGDIIIHRCHCHQLHIIDIIYIMAFVLPLLLTLIIIREKRLFFMEAVWSRTFPVYKVGEPGHPIIVINTFLLLLLLLLIIIIITWWTSLLSSQYYIL